jgi:hypothetical protein
MQRPDVHLSSRADLTEPPDRLSRLPDTLVALLREMQGRELPKRCRAGEGLGHSPCERPDRGWLCRLASERQCRAVSSIRCSRASQHPRELVGSG